MNERSHPSAIMTVKPAAKQIVPMLECLPTDISGIRSSATLSLCAGSDIRVVQMLLGHTDIKTTSRYTHPDMDAMSQKGCGIRSTPENDPSQDIFNASTV